jgi:hypothetical protein
MSKQITSPYSKRTYSSTASKTANTNSQFPKLQIDALQKLKSFGTSANKVSRYLTTGWSRKTGAPQIMKMPNRSRN